MPRTDNVHVDRLEPLISPADLKAAVRATDAHYDTVAEARGVIRDILHGRDERTLVIVGPCSIHDPQAALEYAERLVELRDRMADTLYIIMRVYFEKPRTTVGWKGLINDPHLNGTHDILLGLRRAREILRDVAALGLPAASEVLDPVTPQYLADLISWCAIGARTSESQTHRDIASGLSMPLGFKNTTDGNLQIALDGIQAAAHPQAFLGIDQAGSAAQVYTTGNPDCHVVLRGGRDQPNYDATSIHACEEMVARAGITTRIVVDCSHAQTGKDYTRQTDVLENLVGQIGAGTRSIAGVMLESHLNAGNQPLGRDLRYGVSITDGCIDWATTERVLTTAATALAPAAR